MTNADEFPWGECDIKAYTGIRRAYSYPTEVFILSGSTFEFETSELVKGDERLDISRTQVEELDIYCNEGNSFNPFPR